MTARIDVFADITCPFTHIGLDRINSHLDGTLEAVEVFVRAWPLEWVNSTPLEPSAMKEKIHALRAQLDTRLFSGFNPTNWPRSTLPALNLIAIAYDRDPTTGLAMSIAIRQELFEGGRDIADSGVLGELAQRWNLDLPSREAGTKIHDDYHEGRRRGVIGSPHFFTKDRAFFCPVLDVSHDDTNSLRIAFDDQGLRDFLAALT